MVEVSYDQVTGNRFRHGSKLVRFRPDKRPSQCTLEQIEPAAKPAKLIAGRERLHASPATRTIGSGIDVTDLTA